MTSLYGLKLRIKIQNRTKLGNSVRYSASNNYDEIMSKEKYILESTINMTAHNNIRKRQSFSNEVGMFKEISIKILENSLGMDFCSIDSFLVVRIFSDERAEYSAKSRKDFVVCKGTPLD
jgi:hypothetical protein